MKTLKNIFFSKLSADESNLSECIVDIFGRADRSTGLINELFTYIIKKVNVDLRNFLLMIELGADDRYESDYVFWILTNKDNLDLVKYMIDKYNFHELTHKRFFYHVINGSNEMFTLFLENGYKFQYHDLCNGYLSGIKIQKLLEHNTSIDKVIDVYMNSYNKNENMVDKLLELIKLYHNDIRNKKIYEKFIWYYVQKSTNITDDNIYFLIEVSIDSNNKNQILNKLCCYKKISPSIIEWIILNYDCNVYNNEFCLINAIANRSIDKTTILLEMGALVNEDCIISAIQHGKEYVELLVKYGVTIDQVTRCLVQGIEQLDVFQFVISAGIDINSYIMS